MIEENTDKITPKPKFGLYLVHFPSRKFKTLRPVFINSYKSKVSRSLNLVSDVSLRGFGLC